MAHAIPYTHNQQAKRITRINRSRGGHWVGDGFPVSTLFSYDSVAEQISPFLLLDYAGPAQFAPADAPRGVGVHPHRGFETVTVVYQGEVAHRDNAGNAGIIGPGDVQWMTAARGILHEEMHSDAFTKQGGTLEMIQLWVNLPASAKMSEPKYQGLLKQDIPVVTLADGAGQMRLIAGEFDGTQGAASTFTPLNLWDIYLKAGKVLQLPIADGHNLSLLVLTGALAVGDETLTHKELAIFTREGEYVQIEAKEDCALLLMSGEPIDEPIAGRGPFVMNTPEEIYTAMKDYAAGRI